MSQESQNQKPTAHDVVVEADKQKKAQKYNDYVESVTPKHSWLCNMGKAFLVGGIICVIGQVFINLYQNFGADKEAAVLYEIITLVALSIILTGFNIYPKIAKFGGAGTIVPITGFANSMAAPAIEYKTEGQVFGIGCKIFTIAGPVILYGIFSSWLLGVIYYLLKVFGIM